MTKVRDVIPHDYGCSCKQCMNMMSAILARNPDGSYFFSDEELEKIAEAEREM